MDLFAAGCVCRFSIFWLWTNVFSLGGRLLTEASCRIVPEDFRGAWRSSIDAELVLELTDRHLKVTEEAISPEDRNPEYAKNDLDTPFKVKNAMVSFVNIDCPDQKRLLLKTDQENGWYSCLDMKIREKVSDVDLIMMRAVLQKSQTLEEIRCPVEADSLGPSLISTDERYYQFVLQRGELYLYRPKNMTCARSLFNYPANRTFPVSISSAMNVGKCATFCGLQLFSCFSLKADRCECRPICMVRLVTSELNVSGLHGQTANQDREVGISNKTCNIKCPADKVIIQDEFKFCGGTANEPSFYSMYKIKETYLRKILPRTLGCYEEPTNKNESPYLESPLMDQDSCIIFCRYQNIDFANLLEGNICFCSSSLPKSKEKFEMCDRRCTGTSKQNCGGEGSVYVLPTSSSLSDASREAFAGKNCKEGIPSKFLGTWYSSHSGIAIDLYPYQYHAENQQKILHQREPFWVRSHLHPAYRMSCLDKDLIQVNFVLNCSTDRTIYQCISFKVTESRSALKLISIIEEFSPKKEPESVKFCAERPETPVKYANYYELALSPTKLPKLLPDVTDISRKFAVERAKYSAIKYTVRDFELLGTNYEVFVQYLGCYQTLPTFGNMSGEDMYNRSMTWSMCTHFCMAMNYPTFYITEDYCKCGYMADIDGGLRKSGVDYEACVQLPNVKDEDSDDEVATDISGNNVTSLNYIIDQTVATPKQLAIDPFSEQYESGAVFRILYLQKDTKWHGRPLHYVGCVRIDMQYNFSYLADKGMTVEVCMSFCQVNSKTQYAGLLNATSCLCLKDSNFGDTEEIEFCRFSCSGGWGDTCGGADTVAVYKIPANKFPPSTLRQTIERSGTINSFADRTDCPVKVERPKNIALSSFSAGSMEEKERASNGYTIHRWPRTEGLTTLLVNWVTIAIDTTVEMLLYLIAMVIYLISVSIVLYLNSLPFLLFIVIMKRLV